MFIHKLKYTLKILLNDKMLLFWTLGFPLILGTFFNLAFSDIESGETLDIIDIAVVYDNQENIDIYKEAFTSLSDPDSEDQLFDTIYPTLNKAKELLENDDIHGYVYFEKEKPVVVIKSNGIEETVLNQVVEEIESQKLIIEKSIENKMIEYGYIDIEEIYNNVESHLNQELKINNKTNSHLSYTMIEFYSLIAMACLYGGLFSKKAISNELADISDIGKRNAIAPTTRTKMILGSLLASYIVELFGLLLLYLYTIFVLNVDYGSRFPLIVLLSLVGTLAGLAMGIAVSVLVKASDNVKLVIMLALTMGGSFLSGMMGIVMKYIVDTNFPVINRINPVNMITDGLYSLYYYETLDRFYFNLISLVIFVFILLVLSIWKMRRLTYDHL